MIHALEHLDVANALLTRAHNLNARLRRSLGYEPPALPKSFHGDSRDVHVLDHNGATLAMWDESRKVGIVEVGERWIFTHTYDEFESEAMRHYPGGRAA